MIKLDIKDKNILHELDNNCRQTNSQISKKGGLSKDSVAYRIDKLERLGIIEGYNISIDFKKLGLIKERILLKIIDFDEKKFNKLIDFLKKQKNIWGFGNLEGEWDFSILYLSKSSYDFFNFYNNLMYEFRDIIGDKLISELVLYDELNRDYLINKKVMRNVPKIERRSFEKIDKIDFEILKILRRNSRESLISIGNKLNISSMLVHQRIKRLVKKRIILCFRVKINILNLERDYYGVKMNLKNYSQKNEILRNIYSIPEMSAVLYMSGGYDIEFDLEVINTNRYHEIINNLRNNFSSIREIKSFRAINYYLSDELCELL